MEHISRSLQMILHNYPYLSKASINMLNKAKKAKLTTQISNHLTNMTQPHSIKRKLIPMLYIFEIYDSKAETFSTPFFAPNAAVGSRMFETEARRETSTIKQFPSDFTLFEVGTIDNGKWSLHPAKINLGLASQMTASKPNSQIPLRVADSVGDAHYLANESQLEEL